MLFANLLGRLNLDAIPRDPITLGGVISMIGGALAVIVAANLLQALEMAVAGMAHHPWTLSALA